MEFIEGIIGIMNMNANKQKNKKENKSPGLKRGISIKN